MAAWSWTGSPVWTSNLSEIYVVHTHILKTFGFTSHENRPMGSNIGNQLDRWIQTSANSNMVQDGLRGVGFSSQELQDMLLCLT